MLNQVNIENILFLDVETVAASANYKELPEQLKLLWNKKSLYLQKQEELPEQLYQRAGIYAEFGKIICISVGIIKKEGERKTIRIKSFYGDDEKKLLFDFIVLTEKYFSKKDNCLCAHNGKEFDFPYIARRILINGLPLPGVFDTRGKKPWEINHLDTMELWRFGDYKSYTSLDLLTTIFNIPTPKAEMDGSMVNKVYWEERNLEKIREYCQKDVLAVVQLFLRYKGEPLIDEKDIVLM